LHSRDSQCTLRSVSGGKVVAHHGHGFKDQRYHKQDPAGDSCAGGLDQGRLQITRHGLQLHGEELGQQGQGAGHPTAG
ncbi:hypothetical protein GMJFJA_GMJFJA_15065, partial [Dysosmobacter welbionis]